MLNSVEKSIGLQIYKFRKRRDITQEQLANLVDVTVETISRLERGVSIPSIKTLEKISHALHTTLKDLFDFEQQPLPPKTRTVSFENEIAKIVAFLRTKKPDDAKMSYRILKSVFEQIDNNYILKKGAKRKYGRGKPGK